MEVYKTIGAVLSRGQSSGNVPLDASSKGCVVCGKLKNHNKLNKVRVVLLSLFVGNVKSDNTLLPTKICCRVCGWGILPQARISRENL